MAEEIKQAYSKMEKLCGEILDIFRELDNNPDVEITEKDFLIWGGVFTIYNYIDSEACKLQRGKRKEKSADYVGSGVYTMTVKAFFNICQKDCQKNLIIRIDRDGKRHIYEYCDKNAIIKKYGNYFVSRFNVGEDYVQAVGDGMSNLRDWDLALEIVCREWAEERGANTACLE